jgi:dipeptidase D
MNTPQKYILEHNGKPYNKFFEDISAIPRNSFDEKAVSDYFVAFAEERGLWHARDSYWNVVIKKSASPGYENHPPVMIQAHTDMICVKTPESKHDFTKDPLELYVENGWLRARGTSLGSDDGYGVAYILAILDNKTLKHPPIEAMLSTQEENGLGGATNMDYSQFAAKRAICLDIPKEGATYLSTAGAIGGDFIKRVAWENGNKSAIEVSVTGGTGGHAALNAKNDQASAIKCVVRMLAAIQAVASIRLAHIEGGTVRNNISTRSMARFTYEEKDYDAIAAAFETVKQGVLFEYSFTDPELTCGLKKAGTLDRFLTETDSKAVIDFLYALPNGTYYRSMKYHGDVFASRNTGTIEFKDDTLVAGNMLRGTIASQIDDMRKQMETTAAAFGAYWHEEYRYPGYISPEGTPLVEAWKAVCKEAFGRELEMFNMHAGTEGGTIYDKMGGRGKADIIALGPVSLDVHSPQEAMNLKSFDKGYQCLLKILELI